MRSSSRHGAGSCARSALARKLEARDDPLAELPASTEEKYLARQVVLVGYGRVGRHIASALGKNGIPYVVVDHNRERVEELRQQGLPAVTGNAVEPAVLIQAHIAKAHLLVIATPDSVGVRQMIENARMLNPSIQALVRCHSAEEAELLERETGAQRVPRRAGAGECDGAPRVERRAAGAARGAVSGRTGVTARRRSAAHGRRVSPTRNVHSTTRVAKRCVGSEHTTSDGPEYASSRITNGSPR